MVPISNVPSLGSPDETLYMFNTGFFTCINIVYKLSKERCLGNKLSIFAVEKVTALLKRGHKPQRPGVCEDKGLSSTDV